MTIQPVTRKDFGRIFLFVMKLALLAASFSLISGACPAGSGSFAAGSGSFTAGSGSVVSDGASGRAGGQVFIDAPVDPFGDVPSNHWAREDVDELRQLGLTIGFPDGFFKGDAGLSRFEFAALLNRLMKADPARSVILMKLADFEALLDLVKKTIEVADRARADADLANRRMDERFGSDSRGAGSVVSSRTGIYRNVMTRNGWQGERGGTSEQRRPRMRWLKDHDFR